MFDNYIERLNDVIFEVSNLKNYIVVCIALIVLFSRENVNIISKNISIYLVVNLDWLTNLRNQEIVVAEFKRARSIFQNARVKFVLIDYEIFSNKNVTTNWNILNIIISSSSTIYYVIDINRISITNNSIIIVDLQDIIILNSHLCNLFRTWLIRECYLNKSNRYTRRSSCKY